MPALIAAAAMAAAVPVAAQAAGGRAPVLPKLGATPAVATTGDAATTVIFAYTGSDNHLYQAPLATPTDQVSLGGRLIGGPGLVFVPYPYHSLFGPYVRGGDNRLWQFGGFTSAGAPIWHPVGGVLTSRPWAAVEGLTIPGENHPFVVARGADGGTWLLEEFEGGWQNLGGKVLAGSGPAAVGLGLTVYVLVVGTNRAVWVKHNTSVNPVHWSGWTPLGGRASRDIAAVSPAPGVAVVFVRGADNALWYNEFAGTTPGVTRGWHKLGGTLTSGVGAASAADGTTWALVLGADGHIWQRSGRWPNLGGWRKLF